MDVMSARQARDDFADLLGMVYYGKKTVAVQKKGKTYAVMINPIQYEAFKKAARERFFSIVDEIQKRNKGAKLEELEALLNEK